MLGRGGTEGTRGTRVDAPCAACWEEGESQATGLPVDGAADVAGLFVGAGQNFVHEVHVRDVPL